MNRTEHYVLTNNIIVSDNHTTYMIHVELYDVFLLKYEHVGPFIYIFQKTLIPTD